MIKPILSLCLAATFSAAAGNYMTVDFSTGRMPAGSFVKNIDEAELQTGIYAIIPKEENAWTVLRQGDGYGYCALSPTRNAAPDENTPAPAANNRLTFAAVTIDSEDALVRWEAKSLIGDFPESYQVEVRVSGTHDWKVIYECSAENSKWTHHAASLKDFVGKDVEVAFVATTQRGFVLAIDNIKIGVPPANEYELVAEQISPRFIGEDDKIELTIRISNFGDTKHYSDIRLFSLGNQESIVPLNLPDGLKCGESRDITFEIAELPLHSKTEFTVIASSSDGSEDVILLTDAWIYRSHFARTSVIDRCSATWCPNCPGMGLTTDRLKEIYGDQALILEAHVNDKMTNSKYWQEYLSSFVYAIPMLVPNHEKENFVYSLTSSDDFSNVLCAKTEAAVEATYRVSGDRVTVEATPRFASSVDNSNGRYKLQYILVGKVHNDEHPDFYQQNSCSNYKYNQFYLQPSLIMAEMMFYHNVVLDWSDTPTLNVPSTLADDVSELKAIAMVVDTTDGHIVNAAMATEVTDSGVEDIMTEPVDETADDSWYTLQGVRLSDRPDAPGFYIHRRRVVKL